MVTPRDFMNTTILGCSYGSIVNGTMYWRGYPQPEIPMLQVPSVSLQIDSGREMGKMQATGKIASGF